MVEVILDLHGIASEYLIYVLITASGFAVGHFVRQLKNICTQIDELEDDSKNIKKALIHLADFEQDMMRKLHPEKMNGRDLRKEFKNILD